MWTQRQTGSTQSTEPVCRSDRTQLSALCFYLLRHQETRGHVSNEGNIKELKCCVSNYLKQWKGSWSQFGAGMLSHCRVSEVTESFSPKHHQDWTFISVRQRLVHKTCTDEDVTAQTIITDLMCVCVCLTSDLHTSTGNFTVSVRLKGSITTCNVCLVACLMKHQHTEGLNTLCGSFISCFPDAALHLH